MPDYVPRTEAEFLLWFQNFTAELPAHATALGLTAPEVAAVLADYQNLALAIQSVNLAKQESAEWVAFKNELMRGDPAGPTPTVPNGFTPLAVTSRPPGIVQRLQALLKRIDAAPACTATVRADLGMVNPVTTPADDPPTFSLALSGPYSVTLSFAKNGHDGVEIESQRGAETDWDPQGFDMHSPYLDARGPLVSGASEQRRYRVRYRDGDEATSAFSPVQSINVGP